MQYHPHELSNLRRLRAATTTPIMATRQGYTLLELMLALALLGALLTVAWSLMGTYRDAEQKGWQLSMRTQTVRAIHTWLQQDIEHISHAAESFRESNKNRLSPDVSLGETGLRVGNHDFRGNAMGFSVTIEPSLAPLPFLERLMSTPDAESVDAVDNFVIGNALDSTPLERPATPSLWSNVPTRIEYRLVPTTANAHTVQMEGTAKRSTFGNQGETAYLLSRVARRAGHLASSTTAESGMQTSAIDSSATNPSAADHVLTAQDLYRQTEDGPHEVLGPVLEESVLSGLVQARFRYFDGRSWIDEWNVNGSSLPLAVALSFDFPQRFEPMITSVPQIAGESLNDEFDRLGTSDLDTGLTMSDTALASEPIAEIDMDGDLSLVENDSHQVHIVVRIPEAAYRIYSPQAGSSQGILP